MINLSHVMLRAQNLPRFELRKVQTRFFVRRPDFLRIFNRLTSIFMSSIYRGVRLLCVNTHFVPSLRLSLTYDTARVLVACGTKVLLKLSLITVSKIGLIHHTIIILSAALHI